MLCKYSKFPSKYCFQIEYGQDLQKIRNKQTENSRMALYSDGSKSIF